MPDTINFLMHGRPAINGKPRGPGDFRSYFPEAALKQSIQIGTLRGMDSDVTVSAQPGKDVVVVHIANGPSLMLHPDHAFELFRAQEGTLAAARRDGSAESLRVPSSLGWDRSAPANQSRGLFDKVSIAAVEVFSGVSTGEAASAATDLVVRKVDGQVDPGVYPLQAAALRPLAQGGSAPVAIAAAGDAPILVLVHGTFSSTAGTFGKLWNSPDLVERIFGQYQGRVYALEHATLGESPIRNALQLARELPQGARLHLLTHSRGGLVAEVLARACSTDKLSQADLALFAGPAYQSDRSDLEALVALLRQRAIRVDRIVRVACPARGTLLASKRLDAYISVLKWTLELAQIPVVPALVEFLGEVAQNKADPDRIPGLAAQMPDSPLVAWLHAARQPIAGELRVVAGDVQGDSIASWVKTLLSDAYYWTDNDFVVQTSSMYGGAPRAADATFVLNRGGDVSHFTYFSNPVTAAAVVDALTQAAPAGFRTIGPLSASGKDASGARGGPLDPSRPAVFVIPGILGSNLAVGGERVWLGWRMIGGLDDLAYPDTGGREIRPDGPVGRTYERLFAYLGKTHDVIEFAFDWRKPIEQEAVRLADEVERALTLRAASGQPVRLVAHSMGGLVARVMQLERPEVWKKMTSRLGARVLMLGTPNAGSWAPMQVLSGDDSFGNKLVAFGMPFRDGEARALMARFPGFIQLQAGLLDPAHGLERTEQWEALEKRDRELAKKASIWHKLDLQLRAFAWGIPPQPVLDMAVTLRKRLDVQRDEGHIAAGDNAVVMVLGHATFTPDGYSYTDEKGLMYLDAPDHGDGRVTVGSALLPGVPAWRVEAEHGDLPDVDEAALAGYLDLLQTGATARLEKLDPLAIQEQQKNRGAALANRGARRSSPATPDMLDRFGAEAGAAMSDAAPQAALALTVVNGNLKFVRQPIMLGHYSSSQLTGSEQVIDRLIGGSMSRSISMGLYPDGVGSHQIFLNLGENQQNPLQFPRPESVIVVGLGAEGELKVDALAATVRSGVLGWAQRLAESHIAKPAGFQMAATLIGSGGSGISAAQSARAIAQGVSAANRQLAQSDWPSVTHLYLTELYLDRATDAWRSLNLLAHSSPGRYLVTGQIAEGTGAQRRALESGYRGADYDVMSALSEPGDNPHRAVINYTLDTKRAREDVRGQSMQAPLVRMLLRTAAGGAVHDLELARTLFKLLVPAEVEPFMAGSSHMQISLDRGTSGIPWEMLDTPAPDASGGDKAPWAIRVKLLRRLRMKEPPVQLPDAGINNGILVIGEPKCPNNYPRLPGAWREATAVAAKLRKAGMGEVTSLISASETEPGLDAASIIKTLLVNDWRIIHIAGHGAAAGDGSSGGVVLSDDTFFGPDEIATLRPVPSLVFVNCCHLAAQRPDQVLQTGPSPYEQATRAASTAEKLIEKGVRCVIAAGWAVDDGAAELFATTFYAELIRGQRFIDAVAAARHAAWQHDRNGTTWAAYQCYGDPDWPLSPLRRPGADDSPPAADEFEGICSALGLTVALETVITDARYGDEKAAQCEGKVRNLEARFAATWGEVGVVAEAFGLAWAEAGKLDKAIYWTQHAVSASDGTASIRAVEQLGHVQVLAAWEQVADVLANPAGMEAIAHAKAIVAATDTARVQVRTALDRLESLNRIQPSLERESLCASAYKRLAMIEHIAGNTDSAAKAIREMGRHYQHAEIFGRRHNDANWFYPALNRLVADVVERLRDGHQPPFNDAVARELRDGIDARIHADPDFQSVVGRIELELYCALARETLATDVVPILERFDDLYLRAKAPRFWSSVRDQLDFVLLLCSNSLAPAEAQASEQLMQRLLEISPRARISRADGAARKTVAPRRTAARPKKPVAVP